MSLVLRRLDAGQPVDGGHISTIVRWLWKLEGLAFKLHYPDAHYSETQTLYERVRDEQFVRANSATLSLGIGRIHRNDLNFRALPVGLDSTIESSNVLVSGVFGLTALIVFYTRDLQQIPGNLTVVSLADAFAPGFSVVPDVTYPVPTNAIADMRETSAALTAIQEARANAARAFLRFAPPRRIEIPEVAGRR